LLSHIAVDPLLLIREKRLNLVGLAGDGFFVIWMFSPEDCLVEKGSDEACEQGCRPVDPMILEIPVPQSGSERSVLGMFRDAVECGIAKFVTLLDSLKHLCRAHL